MYKATTASHAGLMRRIEDITIARSRDVRADAYHASLVPLGKLVLRPLPPRIPAMPVTLPRRSGQHVQ